MQRLLRETDAVAEVHNTVRAGVPVQLLDAAAWDRQLEKDASGGKLDEVAAEALADHAAGGRSREL